MAVSIHIKFGFHHYFELPTDCLSVELPHEMTLGQLLEMHGIPPRNVCMALINEQRAALDIMVRDNDSISLPRPLTVVEKRPNLIGRQGSGLPYCLNSANLTAHE